MKLSEAIRKGAAIRPQCKKLLFNRGCSCAIGAAIEGAQLFDIDEVEFTHPQVILNTVNKEWPFLINRVVGYLHFSKFAYENIIDLNDSGITREEIADNLEKMGY